MDISARKILTNIFYYSFAIFVVLFSILFMVLLGTKDVALWWMIILYVWAGLVILAVLFDVFSAMRGQYRFASGIVTYLLSIVFLVVGFIIFARMGTNGVIAAADLDVFSTLIYFPLALTIGLNVLFALGNSMMRINEE